MAKYREPVSESVRKALGDDSHQVIEQVRQLENKLGENMSYVVSNGRFPRWSLERWVAILGSLIMTTVGIGWWAGRLEVRQLNSELTTNNVIEMIKETREISELNSKSITTMQIDLARIEGRLVASSPQAPAAAERNP